MFNKVQVLPGPGGRRGFTIVEIVMACIIIAILAIVLTPVLTSHANNARLDACKEELKALADAEERACIDTGYLYRPYVLNDVRGGDGIANAPLTLPVPVAQQSRINGIRDNGVSNGNLYQNPSWIFISPKTGLFLSNQQNIFVRLAGSQMGDLSLDLGAETRFNWNGPYINWQHDDQQLDWPQDPWGHPYLLFTREGVIYPPTRTATGTGGGTPNPDNSFAMQPTGPPTDMGEGFTFPARLIFDRPTWLSLGPNGEPGGGTTDATNDGYGKGDDLFYSFGGS